MQQAPQTTLSRSSAVDAVAPVAAGTGVRRARAARGAASGLFSLIPRAGSAAATSAQAKPGKLSFLSVLKRVAAAREEGGRASKSLRPAKAKTGGRRVAESLAAETTPPKGTRRAAADKRDQQPILSPDSATALAAAVASPSVRAAAAGKTAPSTRSLAERRGAASLDSRSRLAELPPARSTPGPRIVVVDLRTPDARSGRAPQSKVGQRASRAAEAKGTADQGAKGQTIVALASSRAPERGAEGGPVLARYGAEASPAARSAQAPKGNADPGAQARFQDVLRDEVVRYASVVVRDGGSGEIRLVLKPESLGEVRIRMKVVDNSIEGRIVVQSAEAKELFRENLASLEAALMEQGFDSARLDVSVSDGGRGHPEGDRALPSATPVVAREELERSARTVLLVDAVVHAVDLTA